MREAAVVNNLDVYGMENIKDVIDFLTQRNTSFQPTVIDTRKEFYEHQYNFDLDFEDVRGQDKCEACNGSSSSGWAQLNHDRSSRKWQKV